MITAIALAGWFSAQILTGSPAATEEPGKSLLKVEISPVPLWPANGDLSLLPAGHSVFYSPSTDEYVVTTPDLATGTRAVQIRVASHRSVDFAVDWAVATDAQGRYVYSYTIQNGPGGHQHVHQWTLETGASQNTTGKQSTWTATLMPGSVTGLSSEAIGRQGIKFLGRLSFISPSGADLSNSQSLSGFSVTSDLAPGFVWARAKGTPTQVEATPAAIAALAPDAAAELSKCLSESWDTKGVLVLGPAMAGSISGPEVEMNYLTGVQTLARHGVLSANSRVVRGVVALLQAAISSDPSLMSAKAIDELLLNASKDESAILQALKLSLKQEGVLVP